MLQWDIIFRIKSGNVPTEREIIDTVVNVCYNDSLITKEIIGNSFKLNGILIKLDESEQNLVVKYDEICDQIILPEDVPLNIPEIEKY